MRNRKLRDGFTLIELIVVIAVLAIIAAFAIPAFNGLEDQSEKRVCLSNQTALRRSFIAEYSLNDGIGFDLEAFLTEQGLKKSGEGYTDYCPGGGAYTIKLDTTKRTLTIKCSIHGTAEGQYVALIGQNVAQMIRQAIDKLVSMDIRDITGNVDSEAVYASGAAAPKRTEIESTLNTLGFTTGKDVSWSIEMRNGPKILWAEQKITSENANEDITVIRYNANGNEGKGTYTVVTTKVILVKDRGGDNALLADDYPVIDTRDNKFKERTYVDENGQTVKQSDATKASFEEAYKFYQQVLSSSQGG